MKVISLKDYAEEKGISYEAVRQQVVRYKEELDPHIIRDGRQQFLDEEAVAFLDAKRQKNPVAIIQQDKNEQIEALEEQVKQLLIKTASQADRISELAQWKADHAMAIAQANQTQLLLDNAQRDVKILEGVVADAKAEISVLTVEKAAVTEQAQEEIRKKERTIEEMREELGGLLKEQMEQDAHIQAWKQYAADLESYNAMGWFKRLKAERPVPPVFSKEGE